MKPFLLLFILFGLAAIGVAQTVAGLYKNGSESLVFSGDSLNYSWIYGCCLVSEFKGKTKFSIEDGKIFIQTKNETYSTTIFPTRSMNQDSSRIKIITPAGKDAYASILLYSKGKAIAGQTGKNNQFTISKKITVTVDSVVINALGWQTQSFSFQNDNDYTVNLIEGPDNQAYTEIFGNGKGLKIKSRKNILLIKRPVFVEHKNVLRWVKYEKV